MARRRLRILFLTPQLPYPPRQGTSIRNYNLIRTLRREHQIDLVSFLAADDRLEGDNPLVELCNRVLTVPEPQRTKRDRVRSTFFSSQPDMGLRLYSRKMFDLLDQLALADYDIVQVEGIEMAPYGLHLRERISASRAHLRANTGAGSNLPALVFDDHNCEYLLQQRNAQTDLQSPRRWPAAAYSIIQTLKLRAYEKRACNAADLVLAVSEPDRTALESLGLSSRIITVPNGIDTDAYSDQSGIPRGKANIVFTGKMDYRPNIDAALWFGNHVLPMIQSSVTGVCFQIVGQQPHERLDPLRKNDRIEITGAVADVRPYLEKAGVFVIPMRIGGGTRLKALEAMASGLPVVSTSMGIEGIGVHDGRELLIRDTPAEFADAVVRLLADQRESAALSACLGRSARQFVEARYDWASIVPTLEQAYAELAGAPGA